MKIICLIKIFLILKGDEEKKENGNNQKFESVLISQFNSIFQSFTFSFYFEKKKRNLLPKKHGEKLMEKRVNQ